MREKHTLGRVQQRRSRAEVEQLVDAFESSGLRRREFCQKHDVAVGTLDFRRKRQVGSCPAARATSGSLRGVRRSDAGALAGSVGTGVAVFGLGAATRIYLAVGATDMRKGFNGLFGLVRDRLQCEPLSGHMFLFCNGQRNRLKLVFWDGSGLWVCAKRLEKGKFRWPEVSGEQNKVQLSHEELALLLGGIDLRQAKRRRWYRRGVAEEPAA